MKLLIDQNISHRVISKVATTFFEMAHVRDFGLSFASDYEIFHYAKRAGFDAIITQDDDFFQLVQLHHAPPKIMRLKLGNAPTDQIAKVITEKIHEIVFFLKEEDTMYMEIYSEN